MKDSLFNEKRLVFMTPPEGPKGPEKGVEAPKSEQKEEGKNTPKNVAQTAKKMEDVIKNTPEGSPAHKRAAEIYAKLKKEYPNVMENLDKIQSELTNMQLENANIPSLPNLSNVNPEDIKMPEVPAMPEIKIPEIKTDYTKPNIILPPSPTQDPDK